MASVGGGAFCRRQCQTTHTTFHLVFLVFRSYLECLLYKLTQHSKDLVVARSLTGRPHNK